MSLILFVLSVMSNPSCVFVDQVEDGVAVVLSADGERESTVYAPSAREGEWLCGRWTQLNGDVDDWARLGATFARRTLAGIEIVTIDEAGPGGVKVLTSRVTWKRLSAYVPDPAGEAQYWADATTEERAMLMSERDGYDSERTVARPRDGLPAPEASILFLPGGAR